MPAPHYSSRQSSTSRSRASVSSSSGASSVGSHGSLMGSSSFQVGRTRDRSAEMELFSQHRKPRSNYRRPSSLGMSKNPLSNKTECSGEYRPLPSGRSHIVAKIPDHLRPEGGSFQKDSEVRAQYRNMSPARPVIHKLQDTLRPEGSFAKSSETLTQYEDKKARRPVIHRLRDHSEEVQPRGSMPKNSEYRNSYIPGVKGDRVAPAWVSNFEKITIDGDVSSTRQ